MWNESGGGVGHELNPNTFYEILKEYKSYIIKKEKGRWYTLSYQESDAFLGL